MSMRFVPDFKKKNAVAPGATAFDNHAKLFQACR